MLKKLFTWNFIVNIQFHFFIIYDCIKGSCPKGLKIRERKSKETKMTALWFTSLALLSMSAIVSCLSEPCTFISMWFTVLGLDSESASVSWKYSGNQSSKNLTLVAFLMWFSCASSDGLMWLYSSKLSSTSSWQKYVRSPSLI